ncbi:SDR family NAD(P)-dependent oxidoreductase [Streptomyces sp. UNOC14_S4]|uniref:SDR family NAD(P)-dependent oxidoreductase n=1 Tax=Streptomyces sp. UNOC14_S4 TaxID=2872340 RepID=UPI001E4BC6F7|nr:SDR family NAD(P)-dependent oxidoreductase [Streptomyces sp. UNOC14_S4]MCC3766361.1 SDR family NAD(P)-dependent oxidoreductase [Streptomyces sp. UNOC14_S4]
MGRSVLVTGATSGVGMGAALRLATAGYDVFATARTEEKAAKLRAAADEYGLPVRTVLLDVADPRSCRDACEAVAEQTDGGPWALVNNAGIPVPGAVEDVDDAAAREILEVNVLAPARLARLVLPAMRRRGEGRIVNISSLAGRVSVPAMGWYCASKSALGAVNDALRMETGQSGVRVVVIEAGMYASAIQDRAAERLERLAAGASPFAGVYGAAAAELRASATALPGPDPIVAAIHRALSAPRPRARYVVGAQAKVGVVADAVSPFRVGDHVKRVALGAQRSHRAVEYAAKRWCAPW